jgi:hypothetical protein
MISPACASGQRCPKRALRGGVPPHSRPCSSRSSSSGCCSGGASGLGHSSSSSSLCPAPHQRHAGPMACLHEAYQAASATQAAPEAPTAAAAAAPARGPAAGPFASLTRIFMVGQPNAMFRTITSRRMPSGPISLLLFIFAIIAAMVGWARSAARRSVGAAALLPPCAQAEAGCTGRWGAPSNGALPPPACRPAAGRLGQAVAGQALQDLRRLQGLRRLPLLPVPGLWQGGLARQVRPL